MEKKQKKHLCKIIKNAGKKLAIMNESTVPKNEIPQALLRAPHDSAIFFGLTKHLEDGQYVGMPQGMEGNVLVIGGNGSGKSASIAKPTLQRWKGTIFATDIKGELSECYCNLYRQGIVTRPYIVFDPLDAESSAYDPFGWLAEDDENNLISNIWELVCAIVPTAHNDIQPFWVETERGVLAAALLHYFRSGLSFSETVCKVIASTMKSLCVELVESGDVQVMAFLGEMAEMKAETLANVDRGLRNHLMLFATDVHISHAFRGMREGAKCFCWKDLDNCNIFFRIPANRIEQWGGAINLMLTQLIRCLERRPEKYNGFGIHSTETLLLLDEFARFGKLEMMTAAMTTLRSKNVNICLLVQSLAQIDAIYGECERRILLDNCQYKTILRADDAETQRYFAELIGTRTRSQYGISRSMTKDFTCTGYSVQANETRDRIIQPHEFATLEDVLLLSPFGFCRVKKSLPIRKTLGHVRFSVGEPVVYGETEEADEDIFPILKNEDVVMLTIKERTQNANAKVEATAKKQRLAERQTREEQAKKKQRICFIVGEIVINHFPNLLMIEPGSKEENAIRLRPLDELLERLAADPGFVRQVEIASQSILK